MNTHEAALRTYAILQARKELREMGQRAAADFKYDQVCRENKRRFRDYHSRRRTY